ncbi:MAG: hypothetical protein A2W22_00290 [Candidatus Levybacteria bacterium RBG_16_35_11]|nr:MAG: hypothetical protein A2W22_00290 [Candidatus Levybacteria bacterium RBG_16_35_11]
MTERTSHQEQERGQTRFIALSGQETIKIVDGEQQRVIPIVYGDRNWLGELGVGYQLPDKSGACYSWGLIIPHKAVQTLRAMKILEQLPEIDGYTLCATYYAGDADLKPDNSNWKYVERLETVMGKEQFTALRKSVLAQAPTAEELNTLLLTLINSGLDVGVWELEKEISAGRITSSPLIQDLIEKEAEERLRNEEESVEEEIKPFSPIKRVYNKLFHKS